MPKTEGGLDNWVRDFRLWRELDEAAGGEGPRHEARLSRPLSSRSSGLRGHRPSAGAVVLWCCVYTSIHNLRWAMTATRVGIRQFRAGLAEYIDADAAIAVTRHGQTVGYFIPARSDRSAEVAKLKAAGEKLEALLKFEESEVDEMVDEFRQLRHKAK